eukprot:1160088-Pelagomonas_calceolata.AAC.6
MAAQRARSKDSREEIDLTTRGMLSSLASSLGSTQFIGYESLRGTGEVKALLVDGQQVQEAGPVCMLMWRSQQIRQEHTPFAEYSREGRQNRTARGRMLQTGEGREWVVFDACKIDANHCTPVSVLWCIPSSMLWLHLHPPLHAIFLPPFERTSFGLEPACF